MYIFQWTSFHFPHHSSPFPPGSKTTVNLLRLPPVFVRTRFQRRCQCHSFRHSCVSLFSSFPQRRSDRPWICISPMRTLRLMASPGRESTEYSPAIGAILDGILTVFLGPSWLVARRITCNSPGLSSWLTRCVTILLLSQLGRSDWPTRTQGDTFRINVINQLTDTTMLRSTSIVSVAVREDVLLFTSCSIGMVCFK